MKKVSMFLVFSLSLTILFNLTACNKGGTSDVTPTDFPYTVTFYTGGGSPVEPKNTDVILHSPTSIKENYVLEGWYFDSEKTIPAQFPLSVDSSFSLYAKWKQTLQSMTKDFVEYMQTKGNNIEKQYQEGGFAFNYEVSTIGKFITYTWKRTYTDSSNSSYNNTYSYSIRFEFGDFTTAEGSVSFIHHDGQGGTCISSSNFYSARIEGNTWLLNLNNTSLNTYNTSFSDYTVADIEEDMQSTLLGALNDIRTIHSRILDYNYSYYNVD